MIQVRLKEVLDERGKSVYWLNRQTNVALSTLYAIVKSKRTSIDFGVLDAICEALECPAGDILVHVPTKKKSSK
jgi:putative transcriptional regulator